MSDPDKDIVEMLTDVLKKYQALGQDAPLVIGYIDPNESCEMFAYHFCDYTDLRRLATAIQDEATLRMIARNQDRIEHFKERFDYGDDAE